MCLEESFSLFYRDALNLQPPKIYAVQRRTAQQCSGFTLLQPSSLHRVTLCSVFLSINVHSAQLPLLLTGPLK